MFERIVGTLPGATPPIRQVLVQRLRSKDGVELCARGRRFRPAAPELAGRARAAIPARWPSCFCGSPSRWHGSARRGAGHAPDVLHRAVAARPSRHSGAALPRSDRGPLRELVARGATDAEILGAVDAADAPAAAPPAGTRRHDSGPVAALPRRGGHPARLRAGRRRGAMTAIAGIVLRLALWLLLAPLLPGIINKVKAWVAGRRGPPVLQLYFDLARLVEEERGAEHAGVARLRRGPGRGLGGAVGRRRC